MESIPHLILAGCFSDNTRERTQNMLAAQLLSAWTTEKVLIEGWKHSEETKIKMSKSKTGVKNGFFGKSHTVESKKLNAIASKGNNSACKPLKLCLNGVVIETFTSNKEAIAYCKENRLPFSSLVIKKLEVCGYKIFPQ